LLFVAVTVGTGLSASKIEQGTRGFLTPTLIRFVGVLLLSLAVLAPWPSARSLAIILIQGGIAGLAQQIQVVVMRHKIGWALHAWRAWVLGIHFPLGGLGITREEADFAAIWLPGVVGGGWGVSEAVEGFVASLASMFGARDDLRQPLALDGRRDPVVAINPRRWCYRFS
jgi:hypothetical protein